MFGVVILFCFVAFAQNMDVHTYYLFRTRLHSDFKSSVWPQCIVRIFQQQKVLHWSNTLKTSRKETIHFTQIHLQSLFVSLRILLLEQILKLQIRCMTFIAKNVMIFQ